MTSEQKRLYFYEWGLVRKHYLARGIDPIQVDAKRHELHRKALGRDKSSTKFTNADFDKVLAVFRGVHDGGNLDAQLRQIDQPQQRAAAAIRRIQSLMYHLGVKVGNESIYVRGISRNLFGSDQYQNLNDIELAQLEGVLVRRLYQLHSRDRVDEFLNEAATYATEMDRIATGGNKDDPF